MGVDTSYYIPQISIKDIMKAIAAICGAETKLTQESWGLRAEVDTSIVEVMNLPKISHGMFHVCVNYGGHAHDCNLFVDSESHRGYFHLMTRSTTFWVAVFTRLHRELGGYLVLRDCDEEGQWYRETPDYVGASDGAQWDRWQRALAGIGQLTASDIAYANSACVYKERIEIEATEQSKS